MIIVQPDTDLVIQDVELNRDPPYIFLGGSIEMGKAKDWQSKVALELKDYKGTVFNPRRDSWDNSWEQRQSNRQFNEQVNWELDRIEESNFVLIHFEPETKSPISLLELGICTNHWRTIVSCPDGFWKKGNVEIVCTRYNIPLYNSIEEATGALKTLIRKHKR